MTFFDRPIKDSVIPNVPHSIIKLEKEGRPFQAKVRKYSRSDEQIMKSQIQELLSQGIIVKSESSWRFAPIVVPKRSGGYRLAIDYRPLNAITEHDAFPIPNGHELIENLQGCKVFSSIDFSQFYYQLPLAEEDCDKTAFFACGDLYEFRRCPFGLKNAVSYC